MAEPRFAGSAHLRRLHFLLSVQCLHINVSISPLHEDQGNVISRKRTFPTRGELHIAPVHPVEGITLLALGTLPDHAVAVRQLAAQDVAEDLGVAVRVRREPRAPHHPVLVEHPQAAELLELVAVVVGEAERVVRVEPAVVRVPPRAGTAGHDAGVAEGLGHGVLEGGGSSGAHGLWLLFLFLFRWCW